LYVLIVYVNNRDHKTPDNENRDHKIAMHKIALRQNSDILKQRFHRFITQTFHR